jgi:luciferase family oxidoreductase group 1
MKAADSIPLSVLDLVPVPTGSSAAEAFQHSVELAQLTERLGYERYWIAEHHNTGAFASSATALLIGLIASQTSTMRIGSGGIMLPNHAALHVTENFLTLEALYPGRIDLGLGRAPGTDQVTAMALRRSAEHLGAEDFPQQVEAMRAFAGDTEFPAGHPYARIRATPLGVPLPPLWLLGSSTFGAQMAAHLGRGFAFAHHFSPQAAEAALRLYRQNFQPSKYLAEPHAILAVSAIVAETEERAAELARAHGLMWLQIRKGNLDSLPSAEEAAEYPYTPEEAAIVQSATELVIHGTAGQVRERMLELAGWLQADELMVTTHVADRAERMRSYELLAQCRILN